MKRAIAIWSLALGALLCAPVPALGWANGGHGGNGFGTHDWVLKEANRLAAKKNAGWVDLKVALPVTDDPDTRFHDVYYHVYDRWGSTYGDAPKKVALYFGRALAYRKQGKYGAASRMVGYLSHYYSDICNPLHTDQTKAEEGMHSNYESAVNTRTDARGEHRQWIRFDGYRRVLQAGRKAKSAAVAAHKNYAALVSHYGAHGYDATVSLITRRAMNRAANGLADMIVTLKRLAPPR